ncbi:Oidioi.mRNA.OKI2018_I69.chr2.g4438.t1.cds [Oikopleura dioica]|uniref:ferroxidase n=1 Tax=Oikopleura dioica TaxID=34765 RepID=A0ABN7SYX4_OIKDI|nr:Oidioi.mRNA.OKI2018_I69.chr2.g4438.t1.cds [Oikopleura dioica]
MPLVLTDWWNSDSTYLAGTDPYRYGNTNGKRMTGAGTKHCRTEDKPFLTGVKMSSLCVDSILANGRGQYRRLPSEKETGFEFSVLEEYLVSQTSNRVQLKTIHAGFEHPILIRPTDDRKLIINAADGRRILPREGDGIFMGVGETLNIEVDFPLEEQRLELLAEIIFEGVGKKARHYENPFVKITFVRDSAIYGSKIENRLIAAFPESEARYPSIFAADNEVEDKILLNCPAKKVGKITCVTVVDFKRDPEYESLLEKTPPSINEEPDRVIDLNMNFAVGAAINGIEFKYPEMPFFDGPNSAGITICSEKALKTGGHCTQILEVEKGELIEFRVTAAENLLNIVRRWQWTYHAIHLHGYEFVVTDIGFGRANQTTGFIEGLHPAISCKDDQIKCNRAEFDEEIFTSQRSNRDDHILKNTVLVPAMGFVTFRIRADNPGIWPFHCHQLFHNYEGMAVALFVKDRDENKPFSYLPKNMPRCHHYHPKNIAIDEEPIRQNSSSGITASTLFLFIFLIL